MQFEIYCTGGGGGIPGIRWGGERGRATVGHMHAHRARHMHIKFMHVISTSHACCMLAWVSRFVRDISYIDV